MGKVQSLVPMQTVVQEYDALREQAKTIKARMDVLATTIKEYATDHGTKDDKGSFICESDNFVFGKQAKTAIAFKQEEAIKFLLENGHEDAVDTVQMVNTKVVETLVEQDKIKYADLQSITTSSTSYAVSVTRKKEAVEVQETTASLPMAASRKPSLKVPKKKT